MIPLSSRALDVEEYPFEELDRRKALAVQNGRSLIDLGVGDPRDPTPAFIREALVAAVQPVSSYPRAAGLPELREVIASWIGARFGVAVDADTAILPILGSKELIFGLSQVVSDGAGGQRDLVLVTSPGYPIPARGARYGGASVRSLPLVAANSFLPDLEVIDETTWRRTALLWLNYPNNPTGAVAPLRFLLRAAELARTHGFLLACDEAYSEIWFDRPPDGALQVGDLTNVVVVNTLSKRSNMTGYRTGFAAGDPELISTLKKLRPSMGVTPQEFVQHASIAAWKEESHVQESRERYASKRAVLTQALDRCGMKVDASAATFYLWVQVPGGGSSMEFALDLLDRSGIVVAPGTFFGAEGEGYVRMAMVPVLEECERAAGLFEELYGADR
jgi:succinyldiaminopimelate transaminase